jgi:hypothetical protein
MADASNLYTRWTSISGSRNVMPWPGAVRSLEVTAVQLGQSIEELGFDAGVVWKYSTLIAGRWAAAMDASSAWSGVRGQRHSERRSERGGDRSRSRSHRSAWHRLQDVDAAVGE